jgi:DNA-binding GntR family transcriptional regulator
VVERARASRSRRSGARRRNDGEQAADFIRELIVRGEFQAGERLVPSEIADLVGFSRIPVREGLVALEAEGLVSVAPRRGTTITGLTREIVQAHHEVIGQIHGLVARWAVERAGGAVLPELVRGLAKIESKAAGEALASFRHCVAELLVASNSGRAEALLRVLPDLLAAGALDPNDAIGSLTAASGRDLRRALRRADRDAVASIAATHQERLGSAVADLLEERGWLADPAAVAPWPADLDTAAPASTEPRSLRPNSFAVPNPNRGARVEALVRDLIVSGKIPPSTRIDLQEIAVRARVSTTPLREAMIALERQGWVTIAPHRGVFVKPFGARDARDHYDLFAVLFALATDHLVETADTEFLAGFRSEVEALELERDATSFELINRRLIDLVVTQAHSRPLVVALRAMPEVMAGNFFERVPGAMDGHRVGSRALLEAAEAGDAGAARGAWFRMLRNDADGVIEVLRFD